MNFCSIILANEQRRSFSLRAGCAFFVLCDGTTFNKGLRPVTQVTTNRASLASVLTAQDLGRGHRSWLYRKG